MKYASFNSSAHTLFTWITYIPVLQLSSITVSLYKCYLYISHFMEKVPNKYFLSEEIIYFESLD